MAEKKKEKAPKVAPDSVASAIAILEKKYEEGIIRTGLNTGTIKCEVISTGDIGIDNALGVGGFPKGRIVEIYGPESSGKTTLALTVVASAQRSGADAAYVDVEHALDPKWAKKLGVDTDRLLFSQPDSAEQALEVVEQLVLTNKIGVIVLDSVAALVPQAELDGEMGDLNIGLQARLIGQAMRKLKGVVRKSNCCLIFINQIRDKIGVMPGSDPTTTPGGRAIKFYASIRMEIKKIGTNRVGAAKEAVSNTTQLKIIKNKVAPPFRVCEFLITFEDGISPYASLILLSDKAGLLTKSGSHYSFGDIKIGNGFDNSMLFLKQNPDVSKKLEDQLRSILFAENSPLKSTEEIVDQEETTSEE